MRTSFQRTAATISPSIPGEPGAYVAAAQLSLPTTGFLRQRQVLAFVPISKSTLWRQVRARSFPSPVKLSARVTAWRAEDVWRWISEQGGG
ncbi:helix-turn-helix transcriptional regulator [Methylibium petroleiphilum]|uniref:helix-turn-helix transcriptional regulator n=1 Tax=Methylibium petroleiphilum TaxID=105560 RepID=UPI001ACA33CF|nr:AlpA family phage regulatory protein [Methylibium petroleiphilum]MBN9206131.1 AlpA family phage regulatory protein [Methylibium petroleiphilum]